MKNYCQRFIIIILLRTIKFMIMIQETKKICTCELLNFLAILKQHFLKFVICKLKELFHNGMSLC